MSLNNLTLVIYTYNSLHVLKTHLHPNINALKTIKTIVINDGSNDGTRQYLHTHFADLHQLHLPTYRGQTRAINWAMELIKTPWALCLNAHLKIDKIELDQLKSLLIKPNISCIGFPIQNRTPNTQYPWQWLQKRHPYTPPTKPQEPWLMPSMDALLIHTKHFDMLNGFDPVYTPYEGVELDFCYRSQKKGKATPHSTTITLSEYHNDSQPYVKTMDSKITTLKNQWIFLIKNIAKRHWLLQTTLYILFTSITFRPTTWCALFRLTPLLPKLLKQRKSTGYFHTKDKEILYSSR